MATWKRLVAPMPQLASVKPLGQALCPMATGLPFSGWSGGPLSFWPAPLRGGVDAAATPTLEEWAMIEWAVIATQRHEELFSGWGCCLVASNLRVDIPR